MASKHPRVQVTVDPVLEEAMAAVDAHPKSKSRLIRDLALRGAEVAAEDRVRKQEAKEFFRKVVRGEIDYDFDALEDVLRERHEMPCKQPPK
jgi:Trm5-related predicted tRNA methylase